MPKIVTEDEAGDNDTKDIDAVDILYGAALLILTATANPKAIFAMGGICFGIGFVIYKVRRSQSAKKWAARLSEKHSFLEKTAPLLLPGPTEETFIVKQDKPLDVRVVNVPIWERVKGNNIDSDIPLGSVTRRRAATYADTQTMFLHRALRRLPKYVHFTQLDAPPSRLAVPIGIDAADQAVQWADFGGSIVHAMIAGQTGSGKDALLRLWFTTLTANNTPRDVQFVVIDGKIDWLSPALAESAYMALPPAGGIHIEKRAGKRVNTAIDDMAASLDWIFEEIERRGSLFTAVGAIDIGSYEKKTGTHLPYIFVIASDIGETFASDIEMLIKLLIMRGRSYGIRLIISMQNPVGEDSKWRSQIGLIMSGYQNNPDHDRYIMGINVDRLLVRPSQLPNPDESDISKGLFIVRLGMTQYLVRTAHLPENDWYNYIENVLPARRTTRRAVNDDTLLNNLLTQQPHIDTVREEQYQEKLTIDQIARIKDMYERGFSKTEIMVSLGFTRGEVYRSKSEPVNIILAALKRNALQKK